jgi:hypothetical protein
MTFYMQKPIQTEGADGKAEFSSRIEAANRPPWFPILEELLRVAATTTPAKSGEATGPTERPPQTRSQ